MGLERHNGQTHPDQTRYIRRCTMQGGEANGRRMLLIKQQKLSLMLSEDAALDIATLEYGGSNLSFLSKNGLYAILPQGGFPASFPGGMLYTCGLDSVGDQPGGHPTHGRLHGIPANVELMRVAENGDIHIEGVMRDHALFGQNLLLRRKITIPAAGTSVLVQDHISNEGDRAEEYCLLYHLNLGYPFLSADTTVSAAVEESIGRTAFAKENISRCFVMEAPVDAMEEQVFYHKSTDGRVRVESKALGLAVDYRFDRTQMPWFLEWKSRGSGDYALGIEPSTTRLDGLFETKTLLPGEAADYFAEIQISNLNQ